MNKLKKKSNFFFVKPSLTPNSRGKVMSQEANKLQKPFLEEDLAQPDHADAQGLRQLGRQLDMPSLSYTSDFMTMRLLRKAS